VTGDPPFERTWRWLDGQLAAGVPGAYRLLTKLIEGGK
jgi:hypothetical protein